MNQQNNNPKIFGCLPQALLVNFIIGALFLGLGKLFGGPSIYIEQNSALYAFLTLLGLFLLVAGWSIFTLAKNKIAQNLVTDGPYQYVRHPMYSAIIFLLNPALAILFRSWLLLLAVILIYFIWRKAVRSEEKCLEEKFGQDYYQYQSATWSFVPNLWKLNKVLFYPITALLIFTVAFICLNFSAVYLRWVFYEQPEKKIIYDDPTKQPSPSSFQQMFESGSSQPSSENQETLLDYKPNYSEQPNFIIIPKINVRAPLVFATGTSQKELNDALNQGVIIYPGSALPGQRGEVFLSGHSSIFPWVKSAYGQVFTLLDKLEAGDIVSLIYNHYQYDYRIVGKQVLAAKDTKISSTNQPTLTLMTCWPIGTALKRLVVRGELIR